MWNNQEMLSQCWCLVGNIVECHEFGEAKEVLHGTKQFRPGAKVYIAPMQWGDGGEKLVVIGQPRRTRKNIEIIIWSRNITNYRIKRVYSPTILKMMQKSKYRWWGDTEEDKKRIMEYLNSMTTE